ncbi:MAG: hypothetical protein Q9218_001396 [Villophora microphyllina]
MADVRSMLRNERANRRITNPHLTYSTTGTLTCIVCQFQIKSEALWNKHLASSQHATNLQKLPKRPNDQTASLTTKDANNGSRKRKADDDSSDEDTRKRTRGVKPVNGHPVSTTDESGKGSRASSTQSNNRPIAGAKRKRQASEELEESRAAPPLNVEPDKNGTSTDLPPSDDVSTTPQKPDSTPQVDEDEWAAFQREVASPPPEPSVLTAAADISAAPLTAAELAAQSREQASTQAKERMEAEIEGEKEDAARQMEEEFEEMAELEERVRRLREKREELRRREVEGEKGGGDGDVEAVTAMEAALGMVNGADDGGSDSDDEVDEWDGWGR